MTEDVCNAYDNLLSFSSLAHFTEYRRTLIGDKGTIANGKMPTSMMMTYYRPATERQLEFNVDSSTERQPKELLESSAGSRRVPGLIFRKESYNEILRQILARQEVDLSSVKDGFFFSRSSDETVWSGLSDREKESLIAKNLTLLNKETATNYRIYGERLHYLTIGSVKVRRMKNNREEILEFPLLLFACEEIDERRLKAKIDTSGFINFWLDKNIFDNLIDKKLHNYEINLDGNLTSLINNLTTEINNLKFVDYLEVSLNPSYLAIQIITGFEAEYIDPAWNQMLGEKEA